MTTIELLEKAKEEIEKAIKAKNNIIGKSLDTAEYQFSQMGRVASLIEIAMELEREKNTIIAEVEVCEDD